MDSSLEKDALRRFIKISKWLKSKHLSSPEIYIKDERYGILIIEDFGNSKYSILCKQEKDRKKLYYKQAINLLILLSKHKKPSFIKDYDHRILKDELDLYEQIYAYLTSSLPSPDLVIYLQAPTSILINRIKKRNRIFEKSMDIEYLEKLNNSYASFFHSYKNSTLLVVNTENIDLLNNDNDYKTLLKKISKIEDGIHYLNPMGSIA